MSKRWKFKQIEPQPARGTLREGMWGDPNYVAEEKYDGDRRIAQFCGKVVRFTGRRKSVDGTGFVEKTENVPHLSNVTVPLHQHITVPDATDPSSLDGTVLDGEMLAVYDGVEMSPTWSTEGKSKHVTSIMGSSPEEAVRKQIERGWLRYVVFDCLWFKGEDVREFSLKARRAYAVQAVREWANPFVSMSEARDTYKREFLNGILDRGGEGVILKDLRAPYGERQAWAKVKAEWTADVVIMGFEEAKKESKKKGATEKTITKYAAAGLIGAIVCGQYRRRRPNEKHDFLEEVATVSGMDDQLRRKLTVEGKDYIGEVIEIKHNGREPTGRFRHPRFKRFREDKRPQDCVYREGET